jgi:predicted transcriptional regulator
MNAIKDFMTRSPHAIGHDQPLKLARERMQQWGIRHLPVLDGGTLVGVLSERDIALIGVLSPERLEDLAVEEAMSNDPYAVAPDAPAAEIAQYMADHKYGSAVVMDKHKVVGIFTSTDALAALATLLREHEHPGSRIAARGEAQDTASRKAT